MDPADGKKPQAQTPAALPFGSQRLGMVAEAADALAALVAGRAGYEDLAVREVLHAAEGRVVYLVRYRGAKAALKLYTGAEAALTVGKVKAELDLMAAEMAEGQLRVVPCLQAEPELGFVILGYAPGRKMSDVIAGADPAKRRRLVRQSGEWLARYTAPRSRQSAFGPGNWLGRCLAAPLGHLDAADIALLAELGAALAARKATHSGRPVRQAATHGDFVPINLHFHRGTVWGLDIQGEAWLAVARDVARYLVWLRVMGDETLDAVHFGVWRADLAAMIASGVLPEEEAATTLPFFIGEQLYLRFADPERQGAQKLRAREAVRAYLAEPLAR